jgi:hypothetical protein
LIKLRRHPGFEFLHQFSAVYLVVEKTFSRGQIQLSGLRIVRVDLAKNVDHIGAGLRELVYHANEIAPAVGQA